MSFTPWAQSSEFTAAKKIVADTAARIATVKADIARMKPKLSTFKRETLEKLIKETEAKLAAAAKFNEAMSGAKQPEVAYMKTVQAETKKLLKELDQAYAARKAAFTKEADQETDAASEFSANGGGHGGGSQGISVRLCDQYKQLLTALKSELMTAAKEKSPSAERKI